MKILIIGATGLLGRTVADRDRWPGDQLIAVGSKELDIRDDAAVSQFIARTQPDWTLLLAAYADVDGCELDPKRAEAVNTAGAVNVAGAVNQMGTRLLFISTDYVFDGGKKTPYQVTDPVSPISVYGRTKAKAEEALRRIDDRSLIVRTSFLYGLGKCFPEYILATAEKGKSLEVVNDQRSSPTVTWDLADALVKLVRANAEGTVHASNAGDCTRYEFARAMLEHAALKATLNAIKSSDIKRPAKRPMYSVLSLASLSEHGIAMRPWRAAMQEYVHRRWAAPAAARSYGS